jgi:hypothetical protein
MIIGSSILGDLITATPANQVIPPGAAQGQIISEIGLQTFLGTQNLAIISSQNPSSVVDNVPAIQQAINYAEARIFGRLLIPQATVGVTFFKYPFTVGGIVINQAIGSIAQPTLQLVGYMFATRTLGVWRMLDGMAEPGEGGPLSKTVDAFGTAGDKLLKEVLNWVYGYTRDVQYIDLDLNAGAVVGKPVTTSLAPMFAGACVNPDGSVVQRIINPLTWPTYPFPWSFGCNGVGYGWGTISD